MKIVVKDAVVFIDLELMEILDLWFKLGYETWMTNHVVEELTSGHPLDTALHFRQPHTG
ncbi:MAG: hypothetical protein PF795_06850 [Kiritimatiellae bacterium]|jgi:hypothetical protein|nr:hypothetical protein [Kiritimatiellia bacterium]